MKPETGSWFETLLIAGGFILSAGVIATAIYLYLDPHQAGFNYDDIGSFVGGISSFLAFLWLIITIFLQYRELRLQRQDLKLQIDIYEEQKTALVGSQKAAEEQLALIKAQMDQQTIQLRFFLENQLHMQRKRACHDIFAHLLYTLLPALQKVPIYSDVMATMQEPRRQAEQALGVDDFAICGRLVNEIVAYFPFQLDENTVAELANVPNLKDYLLLLSALLFAVECQYGDDYSTHSDTVLLQFIERGLRELSRITPKLPSTGDRLSAQIEALSATRN